MEENVNVTELFGCDVFNDAVMEERLPKKVYKELKETIEEGKELSLEIADVVAHEMKEWAIEKGATHFSHWFQPMTGVTAEKHDAFITALFNTVFVTIVGTLLCVSVTFTFAYALTKREMPGYRFMIGMVIASMLFNPGIVSLFLTVKSFGLLNTRWALIIPVLSSYYYVILAKTSIAGIPMELEEAARIDGANDLKIFFSIVIPLSKAVLATLVLFLAVYHWNVYFNSVVYINDSKLRTLQVYVKTLIIDNAVDSIDVEKVPSELIRYATVVLAMLPIIVVYPFLQKHFVKGVMVGSVKG